MKTARLTRFRDARAVRAVVVAVAGALALAACGSAAPAVVAAPGIKPTAACGTFNLAVNPWIGYDADAAVVSYIARNNLGCKVVQHNQAEVASWKALAAGKIDAILEDWGHDDLKKKYVDDQKVAVEAGLDGNKGVIGWYVPPWMAEKYPDIVHWQNLKKYTDLFKASGSTSSQGVFFDGDPTFVTNDKALIQNLGLNLKVVYTGSEDKLIAAFRQAQDKKQPMIGYFYSPQWFLSEVPLANIQLPAYTPGCDADPKTVKCDYEPYDLDKIENKKFAYSGSPAAELVQNFTWTNDDQNSVARDLNDGMKPDAAAKKWMDAHRSTWLKWLPPGAKTTT